MKKRVREEGSHQDEKDTLFDVFGDVAGELLAAFGVPLWRKKPVETCIFKKEKKEAVIRKCLENIVLLLHPFADHTILSINFSADTIRSQIERQFYTLSSEEQQQLCEELQHYIDGENKDGENKKLPSFFEDIPSFMGVGKEGVLERILWHMQEKKHKNQFLFPLAKEYIASLPLSTKKQLSVEIEEYFDTFLCGEESVMGENLQALTVKLQLSDPFEFLKAFGGTLKKTVSVEQKERDKRSKQEWKS